METMIGLVICCGIGLGVWQGIQRLYVWYEERVPEDIQDKIYTYSKDFPKLVLNWGVGLLFWAAVGGILLYLVLKPLGLARILPDVSWAPLVIVWCVTGILFHYWETPHRTKEPKIRGRRLIDSAKSDAKKPPQPSSTKRGRTIRSYRDLK